MHWQPMCFFLSEDEAGQTVLAELVALLTKYSAARWQNSEVKFLTQVSCETLTANFEKGSNFHVVSNCLKSICRTSKLHKLLKRKNNNLEVSFIICFISSFDKTFFHLPATKITCNVMCQETTFLLLRTFTFITRKLEIVSPSQLKAS